MQATTPFDDRSVSLAGAPDQLAELSTVLASRTRLDVIRALMLASEPLSINEVARRVGVDASPARMHLEALVKAAIAEEVTDETTRRGRRLFTTRLRDARLILEGVNRRDRRVARAAGAAPKVVGKLEKKLAALGGEMARLEKKARAIQDEIDAAWTKAAAHPAKVQPKPGA